MFAVENLKGFFAKAMKEIPNGDIGVAVSGGGDSIALLYLTVDWALKNGRSLKSATVDHGIRLESESECHYVEEISRELSVQHTTLKWIDHNNGNLQKLAREARHKLLRQWAIRNNLSVVLFGHTLDDNAETIMIRLSRGSGIDGLTGISKSININDLAIFRPLLQVSRLELRNYLKSESIRWIDEPSNFDQRFKRIRIRQLLPKLTEVGITAHKLISMAEHMARAKEALDLEVTRFAKIHVNQEAWGDLVFERDAFTRLPSEYQMRLLAAALRWISGSAYRPRFKSLKTLSNLLICDQSMSGFSLMGSIVRCKKNRIIIAREFSAIPKHQKITKKTFIWDKKWNLKVDPFQPNILAVGPLGKNGLGQINTKNIENIPRNALISSVALFQNDRVICVPSLSYGTGLTAELVGGPKSFLNFLSTY